MYRCLRLKKESKAWDLPYYFAPQKPKSIDWFSAFRPSDVHFCGLDTVMLPKCIASVSIRFGIEAEDITNFGLNHTYYNLGFLYCIPQRLYGGCTAHFALLCPFNGRSAFNYDSRSQPTPFIKKCWFGRELQQTPNRFKDVVRTTSIIFTLYFVLCSEVSVVSLLVHRVFVSKYYYALLLADCPNYLGSVYATH